MDMESYKEEDLAARLYHSLLGKLPANVTATPAYKFGSNFAAFQNILFTTKLSRCYFFRAVPEIVFTTKKTLTRAVFVDETNLLQIKDGGKMATSRATTNAPVHIPMRKWQHSYTF